MFGAEVIALTTAPTLAVICQFPPFEEGHIGRSQWVGVLLNFDGRPGYPHDATVYTITNTPGGPKLINLGTVQARGEGAAELHAMFVDNNLYIVNNRYAPGSMDKRYGYIEIQRFAIQNDKLIQEPKVA